ncbi:MAG: type II toxin-antitoxin system ParD family antitoxin [Pseudomonadota bacterium]
MATVKRSISLTEQQAGWVRSQIDSGLYNNESEVFRDLIRDRISREQEIESIRAALVKGEHSGPSPKRPEDIWAEAQRRHRRQNA